MLRFFSRLHIGARIGVRLSGAFLLVALLGGTIGAFGVWGLARINDMNDQIAQIEFRGLSDIKEANISLIAAGRARKSFLLAATDEERAALRREFDRDVQNLERLRAQAAQNFTRDNGQRLLAAFGEAETAWKREAAAFFDEAARQPLAQLDPAIAGINKRAADTSDKAEHLMSELAQVKEQAADEAVREVTELYRSTRLLVILLSVAGVVIGLLLGWWVTRGIVRPLGQAVEAARRVANGDLSGNIQVTSRDETGDLMAALKAMNENLSRIVRDVRDGCESIASASSQIAQGNADLSQRTEEQAASLEQTAASMEQLTSTVQQNASNAGEAEKLVTQASAVAARGGEVVNVVVQTMSAISESSRRIADITSVIDGIAFQTNILALNAAVEAARAGEQGRGFAVVAGEVRTLAQRSAVAAKEIKALIDESVHRVEGGTRQADEAGSTMREVVDSVRQAAVLVHEIASASAEQSTGIGQVNQAVAQMDTVTQQNAALVEQAAAAAGSMQDQASRLSQQVRRFKLDAGAVSLGAGPQARLIQAGRATPHPPIAAPRQEPAVARPVLNHAADEDDWSSF
ncbi:methyl-accepting chemotaxis protein [Achromobacter ruhlandii]|uniref:HAMP domain-containing protein n=1 Tax=Achromobacter ruhlandii TaxID=72557 RepID=A0A848NJ61_9BURK|nr:methyl-accepting chemotaxis protein [Achromobacter ruhlandii]AKP89824.1 Methyl-accepting chemotaxis protein I / serine chemoreceptor protein [Achromobacter xylosoxidans]AOU92869.1 methyl-accepting chemotaxis protein [Achromobacter ruhlandii]MCV6795879.1 methyl-accepting chemotaxis protein [Achromobacter ruhlandii]MCV6806257.1 methyl-accepting chemotaxis protein [Achromobacter ruhlandii]MCV6807851.1 methyl-accepting chemotaxis protein [Achromobacter ruhlandii]